MIRFRFNDDTADDDTADSGPIYQAFSWHIQIFFLNLHAESESSWERQGLYRPVKNDLDPLKEAIDYFLSML